MGYYIARSLLAGVPYLSAEYIVSYRTDVTANLRTFNKYKVIVRFCFFFYLLKLVDVSVGLCCRIACEGLKSNGVLMVFMGY